MNIYRDRRNVCSFKCAKQYQLVIAKELETPKECQFCSIIFYAKNIHSKYCSDKCKKEKTKKRSEYSIFHRDKFRCIYCGKSSIEHGVTLHIEHVNAIGCNGISELNNLITSCQRCNNSKNINKLDPEVKDRIMFVLFERNKNLTSEQLFEIQKEIEFYKSKDNDRWMKISFKKRRANS